MPPRFTPPHDLSPYRGFIFDCDGTLVDSMPVHFQAWRAGLRAARAPFEFTWIEFLSRAGMSLDGTVDELEKKYSCTLNRQAIRETKDLSYLQTEECILPILDVVEFARHLYGRYPMAVASGGHRDDVERVLVRLGLRHLFSTVITPSDVMRGKPDPEMFLLAASRINAAPHECLVLEDGESGFEAARRAKMTCAVVAPGECPPLIEDE
jgi:HAD superfamily hydrolase (TIGR01509 family)